LYNYIETKAPLNVIFGLFYVTLLGPSITSWY
jgi:hypothetical protein